VGKSICAECSSLLTVSKH